ncbi:MAG TPA: sugar ABC transporter permease [Aggregatilineales bacterium]|nr:sugar ABC transporter permease [Aggregatilineales bacterium]
MAAIRFRVFPRTYDQAGNDKQRRQLGKALLVTLFTLPGMAIFFIFLLMPISESFPLSLFKWNGLGPLNNFVGLDNYTQLLSNSTFQHSVTHSFIIMLLSLCIQLPLSLGLALLVGRGELPGRRLFRTLLFIPFVFSEIITAIIWLYVFKPDNGLLNVLLQSIIPSFKPVPWLGDATNPSLVLYCIFAVITWKYFGFHMILYMAGLQNVPKDLEEAARVDGANGFNVLRFITFPLLGPTIRLSVFLSVLGSFQQFVIIWIMTLGGPVDFSHVIATYMYQFGIVRFLLGYGSSIAVVLFAITLVFSIGYQRIVLRRDYTAGAF